MERGHSDYDGRAAGSSWSLPALSSLTSKLAALRHPDQQANAPVRRHAFRRLQTHYQFLPLLIVTIILTLVTVILTGYIAARANAISAAEASAAADAQIAREVMGERGQFPALSGNQLAMVSGKATYPLAGDTWAVDRVRKLTGDLAVIYQLQDSALVAVASNLPQSDSQGHAIANSRALGQAIPTEARMALLGACNTVSASTADCTGFSGVVTVAKTSYVAGYVPLLDANGRLVGAVGVMDPLDDVLMAPGQLALLLLLLGLLAGSVALVAGTWVAGRFPNPLLRQLDSQLDTMARAASELGRLAHQQQSRLQHQQRTARQVGDHALRLEALTATMDHEQVALHETANAIWAEMSQPGIAINAAMALRLAREAAVHASEVGVAGEETQAHARQVITLMNRVIAEGRALAQEGQEAEAHASELAETLDRMETDLGEQLVAHRFDLGSTPLVRRIASASQRLRELLHSGDGATTGPRSTGRPFRRTNGSSTQARGALSQLPPHDGSGRYPSAPMRGNDSLSGFPRPNNPRQPGGQRPGDDSPAPPGGLPPLGRYDDDPPPRGPNDSHWLNE